VRVVLQRVISASVRVGTEQVAAMGPGLLLLVGIAEGDDETTAARVARKCGEMRVFQDQHGQFERSVLDGAGAVLVVSQFTLLADVRKGRRPSFTAAAPPDAAEPLVAAFAAELRRLGVTVECGGFGAHMVVALENDGPVTVVVDSAELDRPRLG
jgi:D-tyrosyl-tRNA(Tyr) deacylase